jgi:hypothetical protein
MMGDPTIDQAAYESLPYFSAVWLYDASTTAYVNMSIAMRKGTATSLMAQTTDYLYLGLRGRHEMALFTLDTVGVYAGLTWEYYTEEEGHGTWVEFSPDYSNFNFDAVNGEVMYLADFLPNWKLFPFSDTDPHTATAPDHKARWWIRVHADTSVTTVAKGKYIEAMPVAYYTTPELVSKEITGSSSIAEDMWALLEHYIVRVQDDIDSNTHKSWRPKIVIDEPHDYNLYGVKLKMMPIRRIIECKLWQDGWMGLLEGRGVTNGQFFLDAHRGIVFFTGNLWYPWGHMRYRLRAFPAYQNALAISYVGGEFMHKMITRGLRFDRQLGVVQKIATKWAAIELLASHDYTKILPEGMNNIVLSDKVENWKRDVDQGIDLLQGIQMM